MSDGFPSGNARYRDLQRIIVAITDGVILIETDQTIIWANRTDGRRSSG